MFPKQVVKFLCLIGLLMLSLGVAAPVGATPVRQAVTCAEDYTVQSGDWLSTIAQKYYGDVFAYRVIVNATNAAAQTNDKYTHIDNANEIEVGQVLCITAGEEAQSLLNAPPSDTEEPIIPEEAMLIIIGNRTQANATATVTLFGGEFGEAGQSFTLGPGEEIRFELSPGDYQAAWTSPQNEGFGRKFKAFAGEVAISWIVPEKDYVYAEVLNAGDRPVSQLTTPSVRSLETPYIVPMDGKSLLVAGNRSQIDIPSIFTISGGQFGEGEALTINPEQEVMIALVPGDYHATWTTTNDIEGDIVFEGDFIVTGGKVGVVWIVPEDGRAFLQRPGEPGQEIIREGQ